MKLLKQPVTEILFEQLSEVSLPSSKASVLTELETALGDREGGQFELSWNEYGAIRRHLAASAKKKMKPRFNLKVVNFRGSNKDRVYTVAILRNA